MRYDASLLQEKCSNYLQFKGADRVLVYFSPLSRSIHLFQSNCKFNFEIRLNVKNRFQGSEVKFNLLEISDAEFSFLANWNYRVL